MSQIEKLFSIKEKMMMLEEGYIYIEKRTITTKFISSQNRDCKAKIVLNINPLVEIKKSFISETRCYANLSLNTFFSPSPPTSHSPAPKPDRFPII
ncbi:unnamed protein product [Rotaria magnacalcarata]|uniref:Uncharacterized protein n=1 Tax=Rotaria magnacalcarata TaxID=392030 RepID=A0A816BXZ8_9BILA|nr:unnamed protein product [Rotaria magnacalcarata]CAF2049466.1 unnamed protein product [Rotaria magnacalcarata]CAF2067577.1 unnamed protein product [Rotaria magnacalcarata]CAF2119578.1 unnamed protein product [Rotaria magnacalcarata]CAF3806078.1 unnamed protein product [Rotaria magnacalcarata]